VLLLAPACLVDRAALSPGDVGGPPDAASPDAAGLDAPGLDAWAIDAPIRDDAPMPLDVFLPPVDAPEPIDAVVPLDMGSILGPGVSFTRVQRQESEGSNPTASFATTPREGNLLVAIGFYRDDEVGMEIAGWDRRLYDYYRTGGGDRRGLAVFSRIAGPAEATSVRLVLDPARDSRLLIQEFQASSAGRFTFEQAGSANSAGAEVSMLAASTSDTPEGLLLVVGAFGSRDDPEGMGVAFSSLGDTITLPGSRTIASAFAVVSGGDPVTTTASWTRVRRATVGVLAFSFTP
jgi:hypothetical protein